MHSITCIHLFIEYYVFVADLIPLCSTPARGMPGRQPFHLSTRFQTRKLVFFRYQRFTSIKVIV